VVNVLPNCGKPNWLANGGFWFAQRQAPGSLTTYSSVGGRVYGADRWAMSNENASVRYQRIDTSAAVETGLQARFYGKVKKITSAGKMLICQALEGNDATQLRGRTLRLQAKMRCSVASAMNVRMGLLQLTSAGTLDTIPSTAGNFVTAWGAAATDPTLGTNLAYVTPKSGVTGEGGTVSGNGLTCALTTSWALFGLVVDAPATAKNLIFAVWTDGQPAADDELNIAEASLTDGYELQDWTPGPIQQELARCQRYCSKTFNVDTAPAQSVGAGTGEFRFIAGSAGAFHEGSPTYFFPVPMRSAPTATLYNPAAANAEVRNITGGADCSASAAGGITERGLYVAATGDGGAAVGNHLGIHLLCEAEI
jgi:hypothetical protein